MSDNTDYLQDRISRLESELSQAKSSLAIKLKQFQECEESSELYVGGLEEKLDRCRSSLSYQTEEFDELSGTVDDLYGKLAQAEKQLEDQELLYTLLNEYEHKVQQLELTLFQYDFNGYRTSAS